MSIIEILPLDFIQLLFPAISLRVQDKPLEEQDTENVFMQCQLPFALCFHGQAPPARWWHWGMPVHEKVWIFQDTMK